MKEFFIKHAQNFEPYDAIDLLCHKLYKIKEMVQDGDPRHLQELESLSNMIDDYVIGSQGHSFEPRKYNKNQSQNPYYSGEQPKSNPFMNEAQRGYQANAYPSYNPYFVPFTVPGTGGGNQGVGR